MNHVFVKTPRLPELHQVLKEWTTAVTKYVEKADDKNIWDYRERTWVGFLAAGAWLAGGIALEEWRTDKQKSNGKKSKGRADLYIGIGGQNYDFEAKHGPWKIRRQDLNASRIETLKKSAEDSTKELMMKGSTRLPTVFASVRIRKGAGDGDPRKKVFSEAWDAVLEKLHPPAYAYVMDSSYEKGIVLFIWKTKKGKANAETLRLLKN